jgi:hypothetical protein
VENIVKLRHHGGNKYRNARRRPGRCCRTVSEYGHEQVPLRITQERAGDDDDDDDHSGVVGHQRIEKTGTGPLPRIEKTGTGPLPKESEYHPRNNHAHGESGTTTKYSGISEKNLVGDEESKEMVFDDDGQHPTKKVGEVVEYPPPKKNHEESGKNHEESRKYSGISEKNLVGDEES